MPYSRTLVNLDGGGGGRLWRDGELLGGSEEDSSDGFDQVLLPAPPLSPLALLPP